MGSETKHQTIGIVGAGLVGCLTALAFASKGYEVTLFELRPDPRTVDSSQRNLRSINLAVSNRGISALKYVDPAMADRILEHIIPMKGRMIHDITGKKQESQIYGLNGESINSIDRSFLNCCLLDELDKSKVRTLFEHKLVRLDNKSASKMTFFDHNNIVKTYSFDYVVGCDGAHSQFRYQLSKVMRMDYSQKYIDMQYIELYIPPSEDPENKFAIDANHLHIWPRHDFMLIALPNKDGSFTSTFFSPWSVIDGIESSDEFLKFFKDNFPDAYDLIGEFALAKAYDSNPRGSLMQVSCYPYSNGKGIILGDAAHSMVPFYGQGMNCGFEDVRVLMELIDANEGDIDKAFAEYSPKRKGDVDAICKLALDNYYEMSSKVVSTGYLIKKKVDYTLAKVFRNKWLPLYTMVSFRDDIPYSKAVQIEQNQNRLLSNMQLGLVGSAVLYGLVKFGQYWTRNTK
ncbi:BNA4 Kynurenine 3-monooxygenase [Candida maltosa Xu316]|uniref:Kynurenine 3-monooxygenase n=1 Tax=Candida maltosa (strain Xu316) TaxID=1245528 RepID=M3JST5_CANMX|nr:Kynurenine 3-monooxygenase [Candida maltosa Xu316]